MKVTTSYKVKIVGYNNIFNGTLDVYRSALAYLIEVVKVEWENVTEFHGVKDRTMFVERLTHSTSIRDAKYDFDTHFYKMPVYLRRAATADAISKTSSYRSNYENWENNGKHGKPPQLQLNHRSFPALFRDNMYIRNSDYTARIKIYHQNDWGWLTVNLRKSDVDYIMRHKSHLHESVPTLERKGKNWYLRFAFEETVILTNKSDVITAVDLGINNAATCSAMLPDGTIIGRRIINFPIEQDQILHKLNKIKKAQQNGANGTPRLWAYANNINRSLSEKTAQEIILFATQYGSDIIVFEHLDLQGKKRGSKKQRLHLWRKKAVINIVTTKAHLLGLRISTVNPWNTSRLAYDGSGMVERGKYMQDGEEKYNYSICVFPNGKQYHCDLNASYNIGARYYIREILKSLPVTERLAVEAKVPQLAKRITCTLADLINLNAELKRLAA